jgi:polyisoprenoid-binding protein YceI
MFRHISVLFLLLVLGCDDGSETKEAVEGTASTEKASPPPPPADVDVEMPVPIKGDTVTVTAASSSILFTGAKITKSHDGGFDQFDGQVVMDNDEVVGTQFSIDLASTTMDSPKLTKHVLSKDFFHVEKYPKAVFVSSEIKAATEPGAVTHDIVGVLDFHGRQRPLSFPASIVVGESVTTVTATFDINRQNWGIAYPGSPDNLIKDDVQIRLNLSFGAEAAPTEAAPTEAVPTEAASAPPTE